MNKFEMKRIIKLTESDLEKIIRRVIKEQETTSSVQSTEYVNCEDVLQNWESPPEGTTGGSQKLNNVTISAPAAGLPPTADKQYKVYKDGKYFCSLNVK